MKNKILFFLLFSSIILQGQQPVFNTPLDEVLQETPSYKNALPYDIDIFWGIKQEFAHKHIRSVSIQTIFPKNTIQPPSTTLYFVYYDSIAPNWKDADKLKLNTDKDTTSYFFSFPDNAQMPIIAKEIKPSELYKPTYIYDSLDRAEIWIVWRNKNQMSSKRMTFFNELGKLEDYQEVFYQYVDTTTSIPSDSSIRSTTFFYEDNGDYFVVHCSKDFFPDKRVNCLGLDSVVYDAKLKKPIEWFQLLWYGQPPIRKVQYFYNQKGLLIADSTYSIDGAMKQELTTANNYFYTKQGKLCKQIEYLDGENGYSITTTFWKYNAKQRLSEKIRTIKRSDFKRTTSYKKERFFYYKNGLLRKQTCVSTSKVSKTSNYEVNIEYKYTYY